MNAEKVNPMPTDFDAVEAAARYHIQRAQQSTREEVDARIAESGLTTEEYVAEVQVGIARSREAAKAMLAASDAGTARLVRLGLIPEPPPWPDFEPCDIDGEAFYESSEGGFRVLMWAFPHGAGWGANFDDLSLDAGHGLTVRGALESLCAVQEPHSSERAAVAAILARVS